MGCIGKPAISTFVRGQKEVGMSCDTLNSKHYAGMLHRAITVKQLWADRSDIRQQRIGRHLLEPSGINNLRIVIEQNNQLTARCACSNVIEPRIVELARIPQYANSSLTFSKAHTVNRHRINGSVVDHNDFEFIFRPIRFAEAFQARAEQMPSVTRRDQYADDRQRVRQFWQTQWSRLRSRHRVMECNVRHMGNRTFVNR
ncbi:hypothetical protein WI71_01970 [Burkholderia diffusa]|nr:hypothetical protein WI71_01970 [Burkholderia diffusa]